MTDTKQEYINRIYHLAVIAGLCKNKGEFAALLEMERTGVSAAMNGKPANLTDRLIRKVQRLAEEYHLEEGSPAPAQPTQPKAQPEQDGVFLPEATRRMFENMSETIRLQAEMLAHFQGVIPIMAVGAGPKKSAEAEDIK